MRDLTLQASNGTLQGTDRKEIALEMQTLISNIDAISQNTIFNGKNLFTGGTVTFQVGANSGEKSSVTIKDMSASSSTGLDLGNLKGNIDDLAKATTDDDAKAKGATAFVDKFADNLKALDKAINTVSDQRAQLGAAQNGLNHTVNSLEATTTNLAAANSRIKDVDMAEEMTSYTSSNILLQAATSMLSQANSMPQSVMTLLQNIG